MVYVPGPHTGSDSGKKKDTAAQAPLLTIVAVDVMGFAKLAVLSKTLCRGKPVADALGVNDGVCVIETVWDGVGLRLAPCVPVELDVPLDVIVDVGVTDAAQVVLIACSLTPRYGRAAAHDEPLVELVHSANTDAAPLVGRP
jgi:hypothetical protein